MVKVWQMKGIELGGKMIFYFQQKNGVVKSNFCYMDWVNMTD